MNPIEPRYKIFASLQKEGARTALVSPVPGEPLVLDVETPDPYAAPGANRLYRITIEEI